MKKIALLAALALPSCCWTAAYADDSFFTNWLDNVSKTQEMQPHWMTPLVTVTPRLEQEYRFDYTHADKPTSGMADNYGNGKGLELIPSENSEVIVGVPGYINQTTTKAATTGTGWSDESLLYKYRIATANEESGNYIVTAFMGVSVPTGSTIFTNNHYIYTPTIAAGKGWGDRVLGFDIQSTLAISDPSGGIDTLGRPLVWSTAYQGHVGKFWPEIETTYTHWYDGTNAGKNQMAITYGTTIGRFEIEKRVKAIVGLGYQVVQGTQLVNLNHEMLATVRITF